MRKLYRYSLLSSLLFVLACGVFAQEKVLVSGIILDKEEGNSPIPGATIVIQNDGKQKDQTYTMGVASDNQGKFSINAPLNSVLKITFVGYAPATYKVTGPKSDVRIYMATEFNPLDEVVIVGYQNKSMADVTSSVTVVETKDLVKTPVANVMELLQGRVAGLNIQLNNGTPGMSGTYVIRGISDISLEGSDDNPVLASSNPLFVIDGIPQEDVTEFDAAGLQAGSGISPLTMIPVEDIDNIQVLKDAAATSLYGSKGAYGVILINTKSGNSPKPVVSYSASFRINTPPRLKDVLVGAAERRARIYEVMRFDSTYQDALYRIDNSYFLADSLNAYWNNNTDWQGVFYRTTYNQEHNLSFSGGSQQFNYKVNGNYFNEKGIIHNTNFDRYSIRTNMGYAPSERFNIRVSTNFSIGLNSTGSGNALGQTGVAEGANTSSLLPPPSMYTASNAALGVFSVDDEKTTLSYDAAANFDYRLLKNLNLNAVFSYTYRSEEQETFTPAMLNEQKTQKYGYSSNRNTFYARGSASYNTQIGFLKLGLTVGAEVSSTKKQSSSVKLVRLASDYITGPIGYTPREAEGSANAKSEDGTVSFTLNPSFGIGSMKAGQADKYIFSPSIRPEANSAYGSKAKWTWNPSLGFKWNFYLEPFMENYRFLSYGALRVTWGKNTYYKATIYDIWGTYLINDKTYNGATVSPINFGKLPNADLKPITNTSWNLGTDLYFFDRKLTLVLDAYYKQTDNQLAETGMPNHNAFDKIQNTETSLVNYGLEIALGTRPLPTSSNFDLNVNFTIAINRDVITHLSNDARQNIQEKKGVKIVNKLGANSLSNYLWVYKGVYARDEDVPVDPATGRRLRIGGNTSEDAYFKAGDPIWVDVNGDYVIDEKDMVIVGNSQPRITGGINLGLRWKNLSMNANFSYTLRRDVINESLADFFQTYKDPFSKKAMVPLSAYDFWTPQHIYAEYPNPYDYTRTTIVNPFRSAQTLFQEDGSYFKFNGISLSYSLEKKILDMIGIRSLSFTVGVNNIYTFSNYSGISPESVNGLGRDKSSGYPNSRSWSVRLGLTF